MALITDQATLESEVAGWLNRTDISAAITTMVQIADAKLAKDSRIRRLVDADFVITQDDMALPSDLKTLEGLYHDSEGIKGAIEIVNASQIGNLKALHGVSGPPGFAAILDNGGTMRFAPAPDQDYTTKITYWSNLPALSAGANWLMDDHPDIYLYATLKESALYLKDDARLSAWDALLSESIDNLHQMLQDQQFSGTMTRQFIPIGG